MWFLFRPGNSHLKNIVVVDVVVAMSAVSCSRSGGLWRFSHPIIRHVVCPSGLLLSALRGECRTLPHCGLKKIAKRRRRFCLFV